MSYTKGPWQFLKYHDGVVTKYRVETVERANQNWGWEVCNVNSRQTSKDPESTAWLIAAAPEMLEALEFFARLGPAASNHIELTNLVEKALAKAKGES